MRRKEKLVRLYAKITPERCEGVFSGITFKDFINYVPNPIENILLLEKIYISTKQHRKFELFEGGHDIAKLMLENIYSYGDFCFVDYADPNLPNHLTDEQIAELLYLRHMFKPLKSPFFEVLKNNFAYLSHDDGWYCKIYCKEQSVLSMLLANKIKSVLENDFKISVNAIPDNLINCFQELSLKGLLLEIRHETQRLNSTEIRAYNIGEHENIDDLFNNIDLKQLSASLVEKVSIGS